MSTVAVARCEALFCDLALCKLRGEPAYVAPLSTLPDLHVAARRAALAALSLEDLVVARRPPGLDIDSADVARIAVADDWDRSANVVPASLRRPPGLDTDGVHVARVAVVDDWVRSASVVQGGAPSQEAWGGARSRPRRRRRCQLLLATHLRNLESEDPACIVGVRRIHRLGFESPELLRAHFSQFGAVKWVAVSNAHEIASDAKFPTRVRPSGLGFVVMQRAEDAAAALQAGEVQVVFGFQIDVREFQKRAEMAAADGEACSETSETRAEMAAADGEACSETSETRCSSTSFLLSSRASCTDDEVESENSL